MFAKHRRVGRAKRAPPQEAAEIRWGSLRSTQPTATAYLRVGRRRGLAPLELVLALPLLLFIMALMANFGTYACWKIRGLSAARAAVWGNRWPRSTAGNPQLAYWLPPPPRRPVRPICPPRWTIRAWTRLLVRGPVPNAQVNSTLLDPDRGFMQSTAGLTRNWPMMSKWPAYHLQAATCLVDDDWQYNSPTMNNPISNVQLTRNLQPRIPILYTLPEAPASLSNAYIQAIVAIINSPTQQQLAALNPFSFHTTLTQFCSPDRADAQQPVQNLIDNIQGKTRPHVAGIAETMATNYIANFKQQLRTPGLSQSQKTTLQTWISELQQFIQLLQSGQ